MKLWLQVLFAQGWLWRERFPDKFAEAAVERRPLRGWLFVLFVAAIWVIVAFAQVERGRAWVGALGLVVGLVWVIWQASAPTIRKGVKAKEFRVSLHWAAGFVAYVLVALSALVGIVVMEWPLVMWSAILMFCSASHWLRGIQNNYLLFLDPVANAKRLELPPLGKGFITPVARLVADAYWWLPKQILFPQKERHAQ